MNIDFHYYATYCAAYLAGYGHRESLAIAYSAQFVDVCTRTFLAKVKGPSSAATTQSQIELANARTDILGLQDITRIWSSFHFLPQNLYAEKKRCSRLYRSKYRLICGPNGRLAADTVRLAKGKTLQSIGVAMHVLADTWAHRYFAGTPSLVINNTNYHFYELFPEEDGVREQKITFRHSPAAPDDFEKSIYTNSLYQSNENSIMNLGHGRAGHLPDYSFVRYKYLPAWGDYGEIIKDNPSDYYHAFCQMVGAMQYLKGDAATFVRDACDCMEAVAYEDRIHKILTKRQPDSSGDWKAFGESLSGEEVEDFDGAKYQEEYRNAPNDCKDDTFLGKFFLAALEQKSMVTNKIFKSGNLLAGFSVDFREMGFAGIKDFWKLIEASPVAGGRADD